MTTRLPVLFIGHGSPMHALADNAFTQNLGRLGRSLPRPEAILCVSAHWMTKGTCVLAMPKPRTIHDFYGFPQVLFDVRYPASGSPEIAARIAGAIASPVIGQDAGHWGLDHGCWAVLRHMYPQADVPVLQLSLDMAQPARYHFDLGAKLAFLRDQGVLIIGSGNIVHNLQRISFDEGAKPFDWAVEFDGWVKERLLARDYNALIDDALSSQAGRLSIPTPDHWYPLFYVLGAGNDRDTLRFEYEGLENAAISMRSFSLGP